MVAIVAVSSSWGIGKDGGMLFHIPGDLAHFRETTMGGTVIMGRKTLESLPGGRPLAQRENIVLSSSPGLEVPGAVVLSSVAETLDYVRERPPERVFVIGGGTIYAQFLEHCTKAIVTHVSADAEADTYFPNLDELPDWERIRGGAAVNYEGVRWYCITEYQRL